MSKVNAAFGVIGLVGFSGLITSMLMAGCSAKVEVKSAPSPAVSAPVAVAAPASSVPVVNEWNNTIPVDQRLDAILRTDTDLIQVCYDPEDVTVDGKQQHMLGYLIKHRSAMVDGQDIGEGWRYIDKVNFSQTAAGKWYSARSNYLEYEPQYPDVTGLQCKQQ